MKIFSVGNLMAGLIGTVMAVSCLDSSYSQEFTLYADFEISGTDIEFTKDSIYYEQSMLAANSLLFQNKYDKGSGQFGGCIFSQAYNLHTEKCSKYSVYDTAGYGGSKTFMLFFSNSKPFMPEHHIQFIAGSNGTCIPTKCMIHNTTEVVGAVRKSFKEKDWLLLRANGYNNGTKTGTSEIYLANYKFKGDKDSVITSWTGFDLSALGAIDCIDFEITSSQPDIPKNFCMDNLSANISLKSE